ncbi:MAG: hypothetical protein ACUVXI_18255 [bacterium]
MTSRAPFGNDPSKIERYRAFWNRGDAKRPLVGFSFKSWFPLREYAASAVWQSADYLTPDMVKPRDFLNDQECLLREGETLDDDILRGASPSQAVPWLDGMLGGRLRILPGSILAEERYLSWDELEDVHLDRESPWFKKYIEFTEVLVERSAGRFPVSHGTLVGPSDLAAQLRGHSQSILDLIEEPERSSRLLRRLAGIFRGITEEVWRHIPLFHGGYFDAQYQLWSPGPIARLQEDATALYSPELYRKFLQPIDRELAGHFPCSFIHLHSTSMFILDAFLEIEEIRCFEINNDVSGPPIEKMIPYFRMVQRAKRPLLIRGSFAPDEIRLLMDSLEPRGLYMYIMVNSMDEVEALRPLLGM